MFVRKFFNTHKLIRLVFDKKRVVHHPFFLCIKHIQHGEMSTCLRAGLIGTLPSAFTDLHSGFARLPTTLAEIPSASIKSSSLRGLYLAQIPFFERKFPFLVNSRPLFSYKTANLAFTLRFRGFTPCFFRFTLRFCSFTLHFG